MILLVKVKRSFLFFPQIFVCGTDPFLETVCGPKVRLEGQHKKEQGPTTGLLGDAGFNPEMVFKL
jgi:hypothetical protein